VTDQRTFEASSIPSLKEEADLTNRAITVRAIARKRGGFGMALGDIVLPEGQTVEGLVKDAVIRSLRESGYRVVDESDAADIDQFLSWFSPGAFTVAGARRAGRLIPPSLTAPPRRQRPVCLLTPRGGFRARPADLPRALAGQPDAALQSGRAGLGEGRAGGPSWGARVPGRGRRRRNVLFAA